MVDRLTGSSPTPTPTTAALDGATARGTDFDEEAAERSQPLGASHAPADDVVSLCAYFEDPRIGHTSYADSDTGRTGRRPRATCA